MDASLFEDFILGRCTATECAQVEDWFVENSESDELEAICVPVLERLGCYEDHAKAVEAFNAIKSQIIMSPGRLRNRSLWHKVRFAAAAVVVFALATTVAYISGTRTVAPEVAPRYVEIAPVGHTPLTALLPDSSKIMVRPGSRAVYDASSFGRQRELLLFGDAYFDVKKACTPFNIRCHGATVRVLGTRFDVSSHDADSEFSVALYSGKVKLASQFGSSSDTLTMTPGEIVKIDKHTGALRTIRIAKLDNNLDDRYMYFFEKRIKDIASELERRSGKRIIIRNPDIASRRILAVFTNGESPEQILTTITRDTGIRIEHPDSTTIELK